MGSVLLASLLQLLAMTTLLCAVVGGLLYHAEIVRVTREALERLHRPAPQTLTPAGRPIELIAADLRRLQRQLESCVPGMPVARLEGWQMAYDDILREACGALGVQVELKDLPPGLEREAQRLRVEYLLGQAGLSRAA